MHHYVKLKIFDALLRQRMSALARIAQTKDFVCLFVLKQALTGGTDVIFICCEQIRETKSNQTILTHTTLA